MCLGRVLTPSLSLQYLEALECPFDVTDNRVLNWLLNHALSLEYSDNGKQPLFFFFVVSGIGIGPGTTFISDKTPLLLQPPPAASKLNAIEIKDSPGEKRAVTPEDQLFDDGKLTTFWSPVLKGTPQMIHTHTPIISVCYSQQQC